jgi:hypothetical protein
MQKLNRIVLVSVLVVGAQQFLWTQNTLAPARGPVAGGVSGQSRADREAERLVALSADKIIEILSKEPGLLLEVKKELVRKAFEQGRILEPSDLSDDALFDLLRQDENIRVLATREIEDRSYIRAKPTREELAR